MYRSDAGFSLLEVLVAVVVFSVGILGLSGLFAVSLKNGQSALLRTQAAQYAYDMADRMRANRKQAVEDKQYELDMGETSSSGTGLAKEDVEEWLAQLGALPSGQGDIKVTAAGLATIIVKWNESAMGNTGIHNECPVPAAGDVCFRLVTEL